MERSLMQGLIFDIQGYSVHDGSGCRTLVFLSGCPLRCAWCANPEGQLLRRRVMVREQRCVPGCQRCVSACPHGAVHRDPSGLHLDRGRCDCCDTLDCAAACLHEALKVAGRATTVEELMS